MAHDVYYCALLCLVSEYVTKLIYIEDRGDGGYSKGFIAKDVP